MKTCGFILGGLLALALAGPSRAENWPTWRHDRLRSGQTKERIEPPLEEIWNFHSRAYGNAPAPTKGPRRTEYPQDVRHTLAISAAGNSVFFNSAADGRTVCLNAATGETRWQFQGGDAANRVPTYWQGKLYVANDTGTVTCLNAKDGSVVWSFAAAPADRYLLSYGRPISAWPVRTDVLVDDGIAYFSAGLMPHNGSFVYMVDANTGKLIRRSSSHAKTIREVDLEASGYLILTKKTLWVPIGQGGHPLNNSSAFKLPHLGYPFHDWHPDPEGPDHRDWQHMTRSSIKVGDVYHAGDVAYKVSKFPDGSKRLKPIWDHTDEELWTDIDSFRSMHNRNKDFGAFRYDPESSTVIHVGGILYHLTYYIYADENVGSRLIARDPEDGKVLWSVELPERGNQVIAANGRIFVATRRGNLYCFAPPGPTESFGFVSELIDDEPFGNTNTYRAIAETIGDNTGKKAGHAVVLDCETGALAYELARQTKLYVIAIFSDKKLADKARKAFTRANLHLSRVTVLCRPGTVKLPLPDYIADLVVSESAATGGKLPARTADILRLTKPIRGRAFIGGDQTRKALDAWVKPIKQGRDWKDLWSQGEWLDWTRPKLKNAGGWTHQYGDAGRTMCSNDAALKPPLGVYWYGGPTIRVKRKPHSQEPWNGLVANGILVLPKSPHILVGCDQYSGRELWRIKGPKISKGPIIVGPNNVLYILNGNVIKTFNLETGVQGPDVPVIEGRIPMKIAISNGGHILYARSYDDAADKDQHTWRGALWAVDINTNKMIWNKSTVYDNRKRQHRMEDWKTIAGDRLYQLFWHHGITDKDRNVAINDYKDYLKAKGDLEALAKFEKNNGQRHYGVLTAIDGKTGKLLYKRGVDVSNVSDRMFPNRGQRGTRPWMMATKDVVVLTITSHGDNGWTPWPNGECNHRSIAVLNGKTGKLMWRRKANYRGRQMIVGDMIVTEPWAYNLRTGERIKRRHPITGELEDVSWAHWGRETTVTSASTHCLFGRYMGLGYADLLTDQGLYMARLGRRDSHFETISGGGLMLKSVNAVIEGAGGKSITIGMGNVDAPTSAVQLFAQTGPSIPVKHLYLDLGADGEQRDRAGNLWISTGATRAGRGHQYLLLKPNWAFLLQEDGEVMRRGSQYTQIENTDTPFVFASTILGFRRASINVTNPAEGAGLFEVRLGFAALPGDKPGNRVFNIRLNGKTVLKGFDPMREAGKADRAIWKTFTVSIKERLVIDLVPDQPFPPREKMPVISAVVVLRKEMKTLGLVVQTKQAENYLNMKKFSRTLPLRVSNLRPQAFAGTVRLSAPLGITATLANGNGLKLASGARAVLPMTIEADTSLPMRAYPIKITIQRADGTTEREMTYTIDWIASLERQEQTFGGNTAFGPKLRRRYSTKVFPWTPMDPGGSAMFIARNDNGTGDENGTVATVLDAWIPEERRGRIYRARVVLYPFGPMTDVYSLLGQPFPKAGATLERPVFLTRIKGPRPQNWPGHILSSYENLDTHAGRVQLTYSSQLARPTATATFQGPFASSTRGGQQNLRLLFELGGGQAVVFRGGHRISDRPRIIFDYAPK